MQEVIGVQGLPDEVDVVVVGAGMAGLACARALRLAGVHAVVLEAADAVGGRVRTDVVSGFRCDHGFQLLNPAYPELRRVVDLGALRLQTFPAAVAVRVGGRLAQLGDPRRSPAGSLPAIAATSLSGRLGSVPEQLAFARWALRAARVAPADLFAAADEPWGPALDRRGISGRLRRAVLEPFLAGVLAEQDGTTSRQFVELLLRTFVRGTPSVPWRGMQALPEALAAGSTVHLDTPVVELTGSTVRTPDRELGTRAVVVATDPRTASRLLRLPAPRMNGLTTYWHAAAHPPTRSAALHLDGDRTGPVVNTVVMSNAAPGYSPDDRALVASTVLGGDPDPDTEQVVRRQLARVYGTGTAGWDLVRRHAIPDALPTLPPPLRPRQPVDLGDGRFVAGDHRDTASLQGALVSGRRAAEAVLARLGVPSAAS